MVTGPEIKTEFAASQIQPLKHTISLLTSRTCKRNPVVGCCWPTICYVRLHGPKSLTGFKLYGPTSAKKCQYCCRSMQTDATSHNIVGFNNVGSVCMGPPLVYLILQRETNFLYDYIQMTAFCFETICND